MKVLPAAPQVMRGRPLVVRFGWMGDMIMLLALVRSLHDRLGAPIDVVTSGTWTPALLERQYGVGRVYWIRSRKDPYWITPQQWRLVEALRRRDAGPTWVCEEKHGKGRWLLTRAGIPDSLIADLHDCPRRDGEHEVDHLLRFAREMPLAARIEPKSRAQSAANGIPQISVAPEWRTDVDEWLTNRGLAARRLILIQPGSRSTTRWHRPYRRASNRKYWPLASWARVIDEISDRELEAEILLTGVPNEAVLNDSILRLTHTPRVHNVARELPMQRLLALQERASGMISVDTGPAHSAAALGCPLVVIFGVEDIEKNAPRSPTGAVRCLSGTLDGKRSIVAVLPGEVIDAWCELPLRP